MSKVRVMLAGMPRMLTDILKTVLAAKLDFQFVGELAGISGVENAAQDVAADVVIIGVPDNADTADFARALCRWPRLVIAIDADGRRATLHELKSATRSLGEISPAKLIAALRSGSASPEGMSAS